LFDEKVELFRDVVDRSLTLVVVVFDCGDVDITSLVVDVVVVVGVVVDVVNVVVVVVVGNIVVIIVVVGNVVVVVADDVVDIVSPKQHVSGTL
jgi:hypothetical protein